MVYQTFPFQSIEKLKMVISNFQKGRHSLSCQEFRKTFFFSLLICFVFRQIIQCSVFLGSKSDCSSFYLQLHSLYQSGLPRLPPAHTRLAGLSMSLSAYFGCAARPHLPLKWLLLARAQLLLHFRWWTGTRRRYHWQYSPCNIKYTQWGLFVWLWLLPLYIQPILVSH